MGRFSRAPPATVDSLSSSSSHGGTDSTPIPPMTTSSTVPRGSAGGNGGANNKSKITSGISTLFRRQSPDPDAWISSSGGTDRSDSGGHHRNRGDPSGLHATRDGPRGRIRPTSATAAASTNTNNGTPREPSSPVITNPMSNNPIIGTMKGRLVAGGSSLLAAAVYDNKNNDNNNNNDDINARKKKTKSSAAAAAAGQQQLLSGGNVSYEDYNDSFSGDDDDQYTLSHEESGDGGSNVDTNTYASGTNDEGTSGSHSTTTNDVDYYNDNYVGSGGVSKRIVPLNSGRSKAKNNKQQAGSIMTKQQSKSSKLLGNGGNNQSRQSSSFNKKSSSPKRQQEQQPGVRLPRRYRGFSTSISSLFLDESIVCGAISCCGLLLSARTEHLLDVRNVKRGLTRRGVGGEAGRGKEGGRRAPSFILSIAWLGTIIGVLITFVIWGFDSLTGAQEKINEWVSDTVATDDATNVYADADAAVVNDDAAAANDDAAAANDDANQNANDGYQSAQDYATDDYNVNNDGYQANMDDYSSYYNNDDASNNNRKLINNAPPSSSSTTKTRKHGFDGIFKLRDYKEHIYDPTIDMTKRVYITLMSQFDADEYHPLSNPTRYLVDSSSSSTFSATTTTFTTTTSKTSVWDDDIFAGRQVRTIIIVAFLLLLGIIGRRRRMRTRFAILRARAQDDHLYYASVLTKAGTNGGSLATPDNSLMENFHEREDKYDGACSHTLFGCYPVDTMDAHYADYDDDQSVVSSSSEKKKRKGGDFMGRTMTAILCCCCGWLCSCWCQVLSICALAQEAREARLLLPPSLQRIDLITHQPFSEYAKDVNNVRRRYMERASRTWMQHFAALSHLSRYIILGFVLIAGFVVMTMLLHPTGGFGYGEAIVLIATFSQSLVVLLIVFGIFHRSDLSFDAVVKFFTVGFFISVPAGFAIQGLIYAIFSIITSLVYPACYWIWGEDLDIWYTNNYLILMMTVELFNGYFVAAVVEELVKYYGFRFLEHPDLLFLTGLDRTAEQAKNSGGLDAYKYDSQLVCTFSSAEDSDGGSLEGRGRRAGGGMSSKRRGKLSKGNDLMDDDVEPELRTLQQQGAAITTGMISVAVGLACAENFIYVFFLSNYDEDDGYVVTDAERVSSRMSLLLLRSIFPVHALSAAMQSVSMIRKFIEEKHGGERNIGVGRIIFPAVLLHGSFDAVLMCVKCYVYASYEQYYANGGTDDDATWVEPYNALATSLTAVFGIVSVMALSFGWYTYQHKKQMLRLATYDMNRARYGRGGFNAPNIV